MRLIFLAALAVCSVVSCARAEDLRYTTPDGATSSDPTQVYGPMPHIMGSIGAANTLWVGQYNNAPAGTISYPTAITGHCENYSVGGNCFSAYFEAKAFVPGVVTTEIDAFNQGSADAPAAYPWSRGFGIPTPVPIAITCGAGGSTFRAAACMEVVREGSTNGQFQFGLTFQADAVSQAGIYMDATATDGPKTSLVIRNTGQNGALPILLQTTGPDNGASSIEHRNAAGQKTWAIRNDGTAEFDEAINLSHPSFPDMRWFATGASVDQKVWSAWASSDGVWHLRTANDAFTAGQDVIAVHRNGVAPTDVSFGVPVRLPSVRAAALPACTAALAGALVAVADAVTPIYRGPLIGGGSASVPAYCNGSRWEAH